MEQVDFNFVIKNYACSRLDIPKHLFDSLLMRNIIFNGKKVADLGSGAGVFSRKLALRNAEVVGVEPSDSLLAEARETSRKEFFPISFTNGKIERTGLESNFYDFVTVMKTWHKCNRLVALTEIKRILKKNGVLLIIDSQFSTSHPLVEETLRVLGKYEHSVVAKKDFSSSVEMQELNGFPVEWFEEWRVNGFELRDFYKIDYTVSFTVDEWLQRVASISWMADMDVKERQAFLNELEKTVEMRMGHGASYTIPHSCNVVILKNK